MQVNCLLVEKASSATLGYMLFACNCSTDGATFCLVFIEVVMFYELLLMCNYILIKIIIQLNRSLRCS